MTDKPQREKQEDLRANGDESEEKCSAEPINRRLADTIIRRSRLRHGREGEPLWQHQYSHLHKKDTTLTSQLTMIFSKTNCSSPNHRRL